MSKRPATIATAVRLPKALHEQLVEQATLRDVSVNYLVNRAVTRFLDNLAPPPD